MRSAAIALILLSVILGYRGGDTLPGGQVAVAQMALSAGTATPASPLPGSDGPRIVFPEPVYDFGTVEQGERVTKLFRFTNQGTRDLRIESVKSSCGCTAAVISADVIPPGQEGTISATFDTSNFLGEKVKTIAVYSNDPLQPVTTLTIQGEITVEVAADPPQLYLGRLRRGEEITRTVEILYDAQKPITITKVEHSHPAVRVHAEELEKDGKKGKKLFVTITKAVGLGRFNDQIIVTTTSPKRPSIVIPVFGSIEGDVLIQPPQVSFGVVRSGESKTQEVSVKSRAAKSVHVLRVESGVPGVGADLTPLKEGEEYLITLRLNGEKPPGRIQGEIRVFTDHPEEQTLTIPLYGMVTAQQARR
jgi:hypothetical protein